MVVPTLALSGLANVAAGAAFLVVGLRFVPRRVSPDSQLAMQAFAMYWAALGAYTLVGGAMDLLAAAGVTPFPLFLAVRLLSIPIIVIGVGSVTFYLLFLFSGDQRWVWPVAAFFSLVLVGMSYYVADREPFGVLVSGWRTDLAYANPYETGFFSIIVLGIVVPPILGAIAYLVLAWRLPRGDAARRARWVGTAILLWSLAALAARLGDGSDFAQFLTRPVLGVAVAIVVVRAYLPARVAPRASPEHQALMARVEQLV